MLDYNKLDKEFDKLLSSYSIDELVVFADSEEQNMRFTVIDERDYCETISIKQDFEKINYNANANSFDDLSDDSLYLAS